jgi:ADP-heptose:LPS heptosyltransferase
MLRYLVKQSLSAVKKEKKQRGLRFGKILILMHGAIGDVINAAPFFLNIYKYFMPTGAEIYVTLRSQVEKDILDLYETNYTPVYLYSNKSPSKHAFITKIRRLQRFGNALRLIPILRKKKIDIVISKADVRYDYVAVFSKLIHSKYSIGELPAKYKSENYSQIPLYDENIHCLEASLNILRFLNIPIEVRTPLIISGKNDLDLTKYFKNGNNKYICIHPGSGGDRYRIKRWDAKYYGILADKIHQNYQYRIIFIGGREEKDLVASILAEMECKSAVNLVGELTLRECAALLSKAEYFVGNDSGLAHLAAASNCRTFTIFGPTNHKRYCPFGQESNVIRLNVECSPCDPPYKVECSNMKCMDIDPEYVISFIVKKMNSVDNYL